MSNDVLSERVLSAPQTAYLLGVSDATLKGWRRKRIGPPVCVLSSGSGRIGYRLKDIREWLDSRTEQETAVDRNAQNRAALAVLSAAEARNTGDTDRMQAALRGTGNEVSLRLLEAVELLAYLTRLSDRPGELLAALRERVADEKRPGE